MTRRNRLHQAIAPTLVLLVAASGALADDAMIGIYADEYATECSADVAVFTTVQIFVVATLGSISELQAAEFSISGYPGGAGGIVTATWTSTLTIGDVDDSFSIAFTDAQYGSTVLLGTLELFALNDDWPGANHAMSVVAGSISPFDAPVILDGDFEEIEVLGGRFTLNCNSDGNCGCGPEGTATIGWSEVKANY